MHFFFFFFPFLTKTSLSSPNTCWSNIAIVPSRTNKQTYPNPGRNNVVNDRSGRMQASKDSYVSDYASVAQSFSQAWLKRYFYCKEKKLYENKKTLKHRHMNNLNIQPHRYNSNNGSPLLNSCWRWNYPMHRSQEAALHNLHKSLPANMPVILWSCFYSSLTPSCEFKP